MQRTAFIGGGNMATAIVSGLRRAGCEADDLIVVEPDPARRARLAADVGIAALEEPAATLTTATMVVWAVKPQFFITAAAAARAYVGEALQLSVMAGVRSQTIGAATGSPRIVRAMPNTPALIGQGMSALHAQPAVGAAEREHAEAVLRATGDVLWVDCEEDLDAVTALSGSGPAYVFYFLEALVEGGQRMGLSAAQARQLALGTFAGATALAAASDEPLETLRQRVTSKGGTTAAALAVLERLQVDSAVIAAMAAARDRSQELGGRSPP